MTELARTLIIFGGLLVLTGVVLFLTQKIPGLGRLPGDFVYKGKNTTVYFPIVTCIIISILLTLIMNFFNQR